MHEIVIVHVGHYEAGCHVIADWLLDRKRDLWWFDKADMTLEKAVLLDTNVKNFAGIMDCEAMRFTFDFIPNLDVRGFDLSYMKGYSDSEGMTEFLPKLVEDAKRRLEADEFGIQLDFYALFEVERDEYLDDDGGLDEIRIYPTCLGELDFDALPAALVKVDKQEE